MKAKQVDKKVTPAFSPVTIEITFESEEELLNFRKALYDGSANYAAWDLVDDLVRGNKVVGEYAN